MSNSWIEQFQIPSLQNLFSFEGIEGSGKSTQIQLLKEHFEQNGKQVHCFREPGGTDFGEQLRLAILNSKQALEPVAEAYLFAASRSQLLREKILPLLSEPENMVLLDRYIHSSLAYQGKARGLGINEILKIHSIEPLNLLPFKTFYLEIDIQTSLQRQAKRGHEKDYFEQEKEAFTQKLIEGFEECKNLFPKSFITISGSDDPEKVHHQILENLN